MAENNNTTLPKNAGKTIGQSGTYITGGIITLEEYNQRLVGRNALQQFDIMRRSDSTIRAIIQVCKLPLIGASWDIAPAKVDKDDPDYKAKQKIADDKGEYIRRELFNRKIDFVNVLKSFLTSLEFGFDVEEKTYELTEYEGQTMIGIAAISKRKQTTILKWETDKHLPGITQILPSQTVYIPMEKLIVFTHDKEGDNYEGIATLRYVYKDWDIKDKLTIVNAIALEKMGVGIPHIQEKEGQVASPTDRAAARESVSNFRANQQSYVESPATLEISMMDMKGNSTKEIIPTLNYHDARISKSILAGFLEIGGHSGSGSQALAKDLTSLFMKSEKAMANLIISTVQDQLINQLCDFNWTDMSEGYPSLIASNLADDDIAAIATATSAMVTAGAITPEATLEDYLREMMGFPVLPDEIKNNYPVKTPPTAQPNDKPDPKDPANSAEDPTLEDKNKADPAKDAKKKAALSEAYRARRNLIDTLVA